MLTCVPQRVVLRGSVVRLDPFVIRLGESERIVGSTRFLDLAYWTDARNEQSRRAIERIGATFEGLRRADRPATDGSVRDSAYYSILRDEWPAIRDALGARQHATDDATSERR